MRIFVTAVELTSLTYFYCDKLVVDLINRPLFFSLHNTACTGKSLPVTVCPSLCSTLLVTNSEVERSLCSVVVDGIHEGRRHCFHYLCRRSSNVDTILLLFCCRICPIFQVSNVTGMNLDLLRMFLNLLSGRMYCYGDKPPEFQIDEIYSVPVRVITLHYTV